MLSDVYFVDIALNGYGWLGVILILVLYHFVLDQLSPHIKKLVGKLFDIIVKRDKRIGFK